MRGSCDGPKVVVFDFDETLGSFQELSVFYNILCNYLRPNAVTRQAILFALLDACPEYLRPDIISILTYLKEKHQCGDCYKVLIYTNNQGPTVWCEMIKNYLHGKLNYVLIDRIVGAFKVNGRVVEVRRTSTEKKTSDLLHCAMLPKNTRICFVDDHHYEKMNNVYYIKVHSYVHNLTFHVLMTRFLGTTISKKMGVRQNRFVSYFNKHIHEYQYRFREKDEEEYELDGIISKRLFELLNEFFRPV